MGMSGQHMLGDDEHIVGGKLRKGGGRMEGWNWANDDPRTGSSLLHVQK